MNTVPTQSQRDRQEVQMCVTKRMLKYESIEQSKTAHSMALRLQEQTGVNPDEAARVAVEYVTQFVK